MPSVDSQSELFVLLRDLSHHLRTPLGIAWNVVRDGASGHALEAEDFQDAHSALQKMKGLLDELKPLLLLSAPRLQPLSRDAIEVFLGSEKVSPDFVGYEKMDSRLFELVASEIEHVSADGEVVLRSEIPTFRKRALLAAFAWVNVSVRE